MAKNLLIVESPAKAKTIEKFLGSGFEVRSCYGHIRDLEKNDMGVDVGNNFRPNYIVPDDKQKVVSELKKLAGKASEVWLASDEDREGESISWHLAEVLKLDPARTKRIVFHEITKPAIEAAVKSPRLIDMNLVNAQQARRVVDRLVGFEISPVLWRKIGQGSLSAGRVQSVTVKLVVEREREINAFVPESSYKAEAVFHANDALTNRPVVFKAEGEKYNDENQARAFLESCIGAQYTVKSVQVKPGKRTPAAPFTTSTLQQEAARKLGYSVSKTMLIAQKLYESGQITYMRTDSVNLSDTALQGIGKAINDNYGEKYHQLRRFKTKSQSAQEAHEAIRPTYMDKQTVADSELRALYELIWKRTIASQMADAVLEKTTAKIEISSNKQLLTASGEVILFDGFLKVYLEGKDDDESNAETGDSRLPALKEGQVLQLDRLTAFERFTKHAARYTEASLVKKLEELGIGRPSTYSPTITTILKRNYVVKQDKDGISREVRRLTLADGKITVKDEKELYGTEKGKLFPTDLGYLVTDFLNKNFDRVMDYSFTAEIEKEFDDIANGNITWQNVVRDFYHPFHDKVEHTLENAERAVGERVLGVDDTGRTVIARMGRFGPMVQINPLTEDEQPKYAPLKNDQRIETISFEEALTLFKLPLTLGEHEGQEVSVNVGRFGPYVKWNEQFISLPKGRDPLDVSLEEAIKVIANKIEEDAPVAWFNELPVTKGKGRFGPFIKWNGLFINVPRAYDFDNLSQDDVNTLVEKKMDKEANRFIKQWPEAKIAIENGHWGPLIRFNTKKLKLDTNKATGNKYTAEEAAALELDAVKEMIEQQVPNAFSKKAATKKAPAKKAAVKKSAVKKSAPRNTAVKKSAVKSKSSTANGKK